MSYFDTLQAAKNAVAKSQPHHFVQMVSGKWQTTLGAPVSREHTENLAFMGIKVTAGRGKNVWHQKVVDQHRYAKHLEVMAIANTPLVLPPDMYEATV